ncbi:MAG TPA: TetR/AcrR family transcriptional regulator [Balneolales bacterium]|nr:TetR/AcrR family transcriptional regulator [Balneolales bacterium]
MKKKRLKLKEKRKHLLEEFTKKNIHEAVLELIGENGVEALTVNKVAQRAGIAKGTVYLHFKDKDELICSSIDSSLAPLFNGLMDILDSDLDPVEKLKKYAFFSTDFFDHYRNTFRALMYNQHQAHIHKKRHMDSNYEAFIEKLANVFQDGIDSGMFRPIDTQIAATTFANSNISITIQYIIHDTQRDLKNDVNNLFDIILNGILSNQSHT